MDSCMDLPMDLWEKNPSPVRCDQSAAAIAAVQAHRSRSPRSAGCSKPTQPSPQRKDWVNCFCIAFGKDGSLCSFLEQPHLLIEFIDISHWYLWIWLWENEIVTPQRWRRTSYHTFQGPITRFSWSQLKFGQGLWTLRLDSCVGLLFFVVCSTKKKKNVTNDKKIQTMYQCRGWSLMILWSVLALFSWCVDRVWWVWWGLLGFGWFLTGDGLLIVWCLHALGYCMYCTYHYLLNFV